MTRAERENLVERYQLFEMNAAEEQEFIIQAATDREIHRILRASRLVTRALEKNRASLPSGHLDVRQHALALLVDAPSAHVAAESQTTPARAAFGGSGAWLTHAATAVLFSLGGFFLHGALPDEPSPQADRISVVRDAMPAPALDSLFPAPELQEPASSAPAARDPAPRESRPAVTGPDLVSGSRTASARQQHGSQTRTLVEKGGGSSVKDPGASKEEATAPVVETPATSPHPVSVPRRKSDSIAFNAKIYWPRK